MADELPADFNASIQSVSCDWYRTLQVLGRGRNAEVRLVVATSGKHKGLPFALKIFTRIASPASADSFRKERSFLFDCDHPAIMRIVDMGVCSGEHDFIVVEYLPYTLRDVMMRRDVPLVEKLSFVLQLLSALRYLRSLPEPVVHCDVKPENIFIKGRSCVLGDFGLMRRCDGTLLAEGADEPAMPAKYRTPFLVNYARRKLPLSFESDVYQLGLVAAELFSGENPLVPLPEGSNKLEPVELKPIAEIPGDLGGLIAGLIRMMLKKNPSSRQPLLKLIEGWQAAFFNAAKLARGLEGRVF